MKPEISMIVPVYNVEAYLPRCVDSLLNQTLRDIEIILVDDGSPDNCPQICDDYARRDARVRVIHQPNRGVSEARNRALETATGRYIGFVDSDDWCEPEMFERLLRLTSSGAELALCGYWIDYVNNNYRLERRFKADETWKGRSALRELIYFLDSEGMFNLLWNKLFSADIIHTHNIRFDPEFSNGEDYLFIQSFFLHLTSAAATQDLLYHYQRMDHGSLVSRYQPEMEKKVLYLCDKRAQLYAAYDMTQPQYRQCLAKTYVDYLFTCVPNLYRKQNGLRFGARKAFYRSLLQNETLYGALSLYGGDGFQTKLFCRLLRFRSTGLLAFVYGVLFWLRNHMDSLYRFFRKAILRKGGKAS